MKKDLDPVLGFGHPAYQMTAAEASAYSTVTPGNLAAALWETMDERATDELRVLAAAASAGRVAPREGEPALMSSRDAGVRLMTKALAVLMGEARIQFRVGLFSHRAKKMHVNRRGLWFEDDALLWQPNPALMGKKLAEACGLRCTMDVDRLLAAIFSSPAAVAEALRHARR